MKSFEYLIEYCALLSFSYFIRLFPISRARFAACRLADFVYNVLGIRKKVVLDNLKNAFPDKTEQELRHIARNTYRQFAMTMIELLFFPKWTKADIDNMVKREGGEVLENARKNGKGAVLVGSHFCNWELMGVSLALEYPLSFVVGRQKNTKVDDLLNSYRTGKNCKLIPIKVALRGVMQALKKNEFVAILSDQDAHELGTFVNFFGRPASTPKAPAAFALRSGCPLIFGAITRNGGKFTTRFELVPRPDPSGNEENDIQEYTQRYTSLLENYCRKYPDHWFWLHRRWKTKPAS